MPHWAYNFCIWCGVRLASPGERLCDRCDYDAEIELAQILEGRQ